MPDALKKERYAEALLNKVGILTTDQKELVHKAGEDFLKNILEAKNSPFAKCRECENEDPDKWIPGEMHSPVVGMFSGFGIPKFLLLTCKECGSVKTFNWEHILAMAREESEKEVSNEI